MQFCLKQYGHLQQQVPFVFIIFFHIFVFEESGTQLRTTVSIVTTALLAMYVISLMGIGRYSCHCDHSSSIALWGISTKCSCTDAEHHKDPGHSCPCCGKHLKSKEIRKDDCCKVIFYILNTDQDHSGGGFQIVQDLFITIMPVLPDLITVQPVPTPPIKTFQALFRRVTGSLYKKHQQLIL